MLEYDNSAFYYFSITLLSIYLVPGTYYLLAELYRALIGVGDIGAKARTLTEKGKAKKLKDVSTGFARLRKPFFLFNLCALCIVAPIFFYLVALVRNDGEVNTFDPFQILGIEQGAAVKDIKKAYRSLSLKYHPDKNTGSKLAEEMFMKVTKAYEALTDPNSKKNWETYGNPDGKQSLEVSIGLPRIVLDNPKVVLVLYLIVMVVLIPVGVGLWYAVSKQYGEKNIMHETYTAFYQLMQETHRVKQMTEVLAASAECRALNVPKPGDSEPMAALYSQMKNDKLMPKPKYEHPMVLRGNLLLHAYVLRMTENLTPTLQKDLDAMLARAPELIEGMIEISYQRKWLETTFSAIKFSQCIVQGLWYSNSPLMQIPHLTENEVKLITKNATDPEKALWEFIRTPDSDKKGVSGLSEEQRQDVFKTSQLLPCLQIDYRLFVEDEEEVEIVSGKEPPAAVVQDASTGEKIYEQDLVTLRITLTRQNTPEGKENPPVYAPYFPKTIREAWWLILTDKPGKGAAGRKPAAETAIHAVEKVSDNSRKIVHELRFMAPPRAGQYEMDLHICSDCYMGLDEQIDIAFTVHPAAELPEYTPHPEDVELDNEPTLFEQVMAANVDDSSDDEESDDKKVTTKKSDNSAVKNASDGDDESDTD